MTDEIICSECGRPNLIEAEKCWYCQFPLEKPADKETKTDRGSEDEVDPQSGEQDQGIETSNTKGNENDIPEWLKRVRELKKADQEDEEEDDEWRQEKLFGGVTEEKPQRSQRKSEPRNTPKPRAEKTKAHAETPPQPEFNHSLSKHKLNPEKTNNEGKSNEVPAPGQDNLPDGFIPLNTKEG